jgi:hypothetical protein
MDLADIGIRDNDERQVAKRPDSVGKAGWEDRKSEVRRIEQLLGGERWTPMSI